MNYQEKISSIVEEALTEKTFSLEIITKIKQLKDDFDVLVASSEVSKKRIIELETENKSLHSINDRITEENKTWQLRENQIIEAEKVADKKTYELSFQTKRAEEIKELFGIVFKNPVVRETAYKNGNIPVANGNGYPTTMSSTESETKTIDKE